MRLRPCWDPQISDVCRAVVDKGGLYGFVSGHAANTTAIVVFFLLSYKKKGLNNFINYLLIAWVVLVSYSRIYLGKHYPLDVICGIFLGLVIAYFLFYSHQYIKNKI